MINWDEFEHIHVIKKLKQICNSWWNIDIVFTDERGVLRGKDDDKVEYSNPAVHYYLKKDTAVENLTEAVSKTLEDIRVTDNRYALKKWDAAGIDMVIVPITIDNELMGTVVAMGFLKAGDKPENRMNEVRERMAAFGASSDLIESALSRIQTIEDSDREHFVEIVELVAQEIVTLHLEITSREDRIRELNKELGSRYKYDNMIGKSKPMQELYGLLDKIKAADSTVLIQGENGTGKELIARAIHYNSRRKDKPFVIQNCSALMTTF